MEYKIVPIEPTGEMADAFKKAEQKDLAFGVPAFLSKMAGLQAAIAAAPDTGMIAVDKVALSTLVEYANIDWSYELKKEPIGSADHAITEDNYHLFLDALAKIKQAIKDMEGNHG